MGISWGIWLGAKKADESEAGAGTGAGIERDGKILTSGICPAMATMVTGAQDGTPKLMKMLIAELR